MDVHLFVGIVPAKSAEATMLHPGKPKDIEEK